MTILCLAIVGKNNEPLFLCECDRDKTRGGSAADDEVEDVFGFAADRKKGGEPSISLDDEVGRKFGLMLGFVSLLSCLICCLFLCFSF